MVAPVMTDAPAFPVTFENPDDAAKTFFADPMHFPRPISPLFASYVVPTFGTGFTQATRELNAPIKGVTVTIKNGYYFHAIEPVIPADEAEAQAMGERAEATTRAEIGRMMERWENEHLPRIQANNARLASMDVADAARQELPALLDEVVAIGEEQMTIHFRIVMPMLTAMQVYDELYADLFGGTEQDAHALLVGLPTKSVQAGIGLSDLANLAREKGLADLLLGTPADEVMAKLAGPDLGALYAGAIREYLRQFGLRQDLFDFTTPTWREDPSIAISSVQAYLRSGHDTRGEHEGATAEADAALAAAREQLAAYPEAVRGQFEAMVQAARAAYFLQEEHNFYIDQQSLALTRLLFLKVGRRLVAEGVLAAAEDIFMLSIDEVKAIFAAPAAETGRETLGALVATRRDELDVAASLVPPPFIGTPPAGPPPADNPGGRAMLRFFGGPPQESDVPGQLKGSAGSRGTATGVARVARTLDEAKALQPGEILVTITTMPAWTPLFGTAAAVVTETGGALSHCAIVAREYGIPAVVGAFGATRAIRTGQVITVDGTAGIISVGA